MKNKKQFSTIGVHKITLENLRDVQYDNRFRSLDRTIDFLIMKYNKRGGTEKSKISGTSQKRVFGGN